MYVRLGFAIFPYLGWQRSALLHFWGSSCPGIWAPFSARQGLSGPLSTVSAVRPSQGAKFTRGKKCLELFGDNTDLPHYESHTVNLQSLRLYVSVVTRLLQPYSLSQK